jgi:hypothetical protein
MEGRPLSLGDARAMLRARSLEAESDRWQYVHGRCWQDGTPYTNITSAAGLASRAETKLDEVHYLFTSYGVIDADEADRIVAETRARTRAELDAEWLKPAEQSLSNRSTLRLWCFSCGKAASTEFVPVGDWVLRGTVECPECCAAQADEPATEPRAFDRDDFEDGLEPAAPFVGEDEETHDA